MKSQSLRKNRFSIKSKLGLAFSIVTLILLIDTSVGIQRMGMINTKLNNIVDIVSPRQLLSAQIQQDIIKIHRAEKQLILEHKVEEMDQFTANIKEYESEMNKKLSKLEKIITPEGKEGIANFRELYDYWKKIDIEVQRLSREGSYIKASELSKGQGRVSFEKLYAEMTKIVVRNDSELTKAKKDSDRNYDVTITFLWILFVFSILVSAIVLFVVSRAIVYPILRLQIAAIEVGKGKLDIKTDIKSNDEIGDLAASFRQMIEDLSKSKNELIGARDYTDNIIKSMIDTLIVINPDATIRTINRVTGELLGYEEKELIGQPVGILFAEEEEEEEEEALFKGTRWEKLLKEGSVRDYDMAYRTKNGENIPVSFSGSVMKDKEGNLVGIVGVAKDMREILKLQQKEKEFAAAAAAAAAAGEARTMALEEARAELEKRVEERTTELRNACDDLKTTQEQLIQSEKMSSLGIMAGGVAHELNNPLGGILGVSSLLSTILPEDDPNRENIETILQAARRCKAIVANLLKFSRQEAFALHPANINMVVEDALILISHQGELANIKIIKNLAPDIPSVMANAPQLQQVFINILNNACDAMSDGGRLFISTTSYTVKEELKRRTDPFCKGDKVVEVQFKDTGSGIPEEMIAKIFDPFVTTKPVGKGTGLGLSVSYGIIEKHNGTIDVQSEEGKGATFTIILPAEDNGN